MASQRHVNVGGVQVGGGAPVVVQTMTKTETANLTATMDQIRRVAPAGVDVIVEVAAGSNAELDQSVLGPGGTIAIYAKTPCRVMRTHKTTPHREDNRIVTGRGPCGPARRVRWGRDET